MTAAALLVCLAFGQGPPPPPPPPPPPGVSVSPMTGTAAIRVRVVAEATGQPVKAASVIAIVESAQNTFTKSVVTDAQGRAWLLGLAKGRVQVRASHPGYIGSISATTPGDQAFAWMPIDDGQDLELTLKLRRGSTIAGVVTDEQGDPIVGVTVTAYRRDTAASTPRFARFSADATDDRGAYRLTNLQPGNYVVGIQPHYTETYMPQQEFNTFSDDGSSREPSGQFSPDMLMPIGPDRTVLLIGSPPPIAFSPDGQARGFGPVFYPNAPTAMGAALIPLGAADTKPAIDLRMEPVTLARVSGVVTAPDGIVAGTRMLMSDVNETTPDLRFASEVGADARFGFSLVPPGTYTINATRLASPAGAGDVVAANVPVVVDGRSSGVVVNVSLTAGPRFSGHVQVGGDGVLPTPTAAPAVDLRRFGIVVVPRSGFSIDTFVPQRQELKEDGSFLFPSVVPGEYTVQVLGGDSAWYASSVVLDGVDVLDTGLKVVPGRDLRDAVVTLTNKRAEVIGRVRDARSATTTSGYVVLFPTDRELWSSTRRTFGVRPDTDGQYRVRSVPSGEYFVVAADAQQNQWRDPAFLETLMGIAERVIVKHGEIVAKDLQKR